jgi:hypothetical protein
MNILSLMLDFMGKVANDTFLHLFTSFLMNLKNSSVQSVELSLIHKNLS